MARTARRHPADRELSCMIHAGGKEYCIDPAGDLLRILGKAWTLPLIGVLGNWPTARFSELQEAIHGIGTRVLAQRLKDLTRLGLISRAVFPEVPIRVEYRLTEAGAEVHQALVPLLASASKFSSAPHRTSPKRSSRPTS
jgi:DNA-binding HxlR family transcriptional regulator